MFHHSRAMLLAAMTVGLAGAVPGRGAAEVAECFTSAPLPALTSGTRVFVVSRLLHEGATNAQGQRTRLEFSGGSVTVAKRSDGATTPVLIVGDQPMVLRAAKRICAYGPGVSVPEAFAGVTPDIVIP